MALASFWAAMTALMARSVKRSNTMQATLRVPEERPLRALREAPRGRAPTTRSSGARVSLEIFFLFVYRRKPGGEVVRGREARDLHARTHTGARARGGDGGIESREARAGGSEGGASSTSSSTVTENRET